MKDTKYILMDTAGYDYHQLQQKLCALAAEGWYLEKVGNFLWKFRRCEPKAVRYEIIYSAAASAFNSRPTESEKDLADLCAQAGWELVGALGQIQIYRNEDPNATPLETDEVEKFRNIQRNMKKHFLPQQLLMVVLFTVQLLMHGSTALNYPTRTLSSGLMVTTLLMLLWIILTYASLLLSNLFWLRKARLAVENGGDIPPNTFYRRFRWVVWGMLIAYLGFLLFLVEPVFSIGVVVISAVLIGTVVGLIHLCKQMNAPRWVNIVVPTVVSSLVLMVVMTLLIASLDHFNLGLDRSKAAPLPLTLTQLTGETDTKQEVLEDQGSFLVEYRRCWDSGSEKQLNYTIVDIHCPLFYDPILNEQELSFLQGGGWLPTEAIPPEQQHLFGAEYIRHCITNTHDRWFICWHDRIVVLRASWQLTEEQLHQIVETLKP